MLFKKEVGDQRLEVRVKCYGSGSNQLLAWRGEAGRLQAEF